MTYQVCELINVNGSWVQQQRDATVAEAAEIDYRRANIAADIAEAVFQIDADTDEIYADAIGNRQPEYDQANSDATAYKVAGYTGPVPSSVQSWADATGWTAKEAADDILAAAARLSAARDAIRAKRLLMKQSAKNSPDLASLQAVQQQWASFVNLIRGQLGI